MAKKLHHNPDYSKNKTADVIKKGNGRAVLNDRWQIDVGGSVFPKYEDDSKGAFLAANGKLRPQPHKMINECDH